MDDRSAKGILMFRRMLVAGFVIAIAGIGPAAADEYPKVLFGVLPQARDGGRSFEVEGNLLQIQLAPGLVVSAGRGALLNLFPGPDGGFLLAVNGGSVMAVETDVSRIVDLPPGAYRLGTRQPLPAREAGFASDYRQGFALADAIMVRQQSYLETLRIDVKDINKGLVSLIRGLFPSSH
jgi:hypothetical protein